MLDRVVSIGIPFATVAGIAFLLALFSCFRTGLRINPVTALLASWVPVALILVGKWVAFFPLEDWFLYLVGSSMTSFILGGCLFFREDACYSDLPSLDRNRFDRLLQLTFACAAVSFFVFLISGVAQVGWRGFFLHPENLRAAMGQGTFFDPSKLLNYANIVFPILVVIGNECLGGISRQWQLLAVLSAATNLFSTGRTKVVWVLIWGAFVMLLSREKVSLKKTLLIGGVALILALGIFGAMAAWMNKYFPPVDVYRYAPDIPEGMGGLFNALFYIGSGLPYFQEAIRTTEGDVPFLSNLLLPYYKSLNLAVPELPMSSEILPVFPVPMPANAGTWLIQFYMDLGIPGVILLPFLIGGISSWILSRSDWKLNHPMRLYFGGLFLYIIWMGFLANKLISTPTWMFFLLGYPIMKWVTLDPIPGCNAANRKQDPLSNVGGNSG